MAAGDFSASAMASIIVKQELLFADPRSNRELQFPLESAKALLENQMVRFGPVQAMQGRQCPTVKATFLKACRDNSVDLTDEDNDIEDCTFAGTEIESDSITLAANSAWKESFVVWDNECSDIYTKEDKLAYGFAVSQINVEKRINTAVAAFMHAQAQANLYTGTYGSIVGDTTTFPATEWTPDLLAEFDITAEFNEIRNPILLSGTNFKNAVYNAQFNFANMTNKDEKLKFDAWRWYFDPRTIDSTVGAKVTFLFDAGAAAFWTKNEFANLAPEQVDGDTFVFAMPSRNLMYRDGNMLKPVMFDVYMKRECDVATVGPRVVRRWGTKVEVHVAYGLQLGPEDCNNGSGILEFVNVPAV